VKFRLRACMRIGELSQPIGESDCKSVYGVSSQRSRTELSLSCLTGSRKTNFQIESTDHVLRRTASIRGARHADVARLPTGNAPRTIKSKRSSHHQGDRAAEDLTVTRMTTTWAIIRHGGILNGTTSDQFETAPCPTSAEAQRLLKMNIYYPESGSRRILRCN
jgi:hypothetical protein